MNVVIFHGGSQHDAALEGIHTQLCEALRARGWTVETKRLETMTIRSCTGCFGCWLRTPGECLQADDGREIPKAFAKNDAVIYLSPISFGGYSSLLKTAIDRLIPFASPLFRVVDGEIHHLKRYPKSPGYFAIGWQARPDQEEADVFLRLVERNVRNTRPPSHAVLVLHPAQTPAEQQAQIAQMVRAMEVK